jgi:hypothetical protein
MIPPCSGGGVAKPSVGLMPCLSATGVGRVVRINERRWEARCWAAWCGPAGRSVNATYSILAAMTLKALSASY